MKVYLAGIKTCPWLVQNCLYRLDTFAYIARTKPSIQPNYKDYILDSGAFTILRKHQSGSDVDFNWEQYVDEYADYVKRNNIRNFMELDIDNVVGYENVLKLRSRLERLVGRQSIPVWHVNRGKDEYQRMVREYRYVAIGGFAKSGKANTYKNYFKVLIDEAHRNDCKIHGLGFTATAALHHLPFDSVDSTSWMNGGAWGQLVYFTGTDIKTIPQHSHNKRCSLHYKEGNEWNAREWVKFQKYAEVYL